jgi:hypothetical protein
MIDIATQRSSAHATRRRVPILAHMHAAQLALLQISGAIVRRPGERRVCRSRSRATRTGRTGQGMNPRSSLGL